MNECCCWVFFLANFNVLSDKYTNHIDIRISTPSISMFGSNWKIPIKAHHSGWLILDTVEGREWLSQSLYVHNKQIDPAVLIIRSPLRARAEWNRLTVMQSRGRGRELAAVCFCDDKSQNVVLMSRGGETTGRGGSGAGHIFQKSLALCNLTT